jgi:hypothetical protein
MMPKQEAPSTTINSEFQQVGYFKSDKMRGFTFFVTNPNKKDIGAFCQKKKAALPSGRILKIHFFDDRANTPDVTLKYDFPESSDAYLVADYFFNPFNGKQGLKVHKNILEQPKKLATSRIWSCSNILSSNSKPLSNWRSSTRRNCSTI